MSDYIIDLQNEFDDTDYFYNQYQEEMRIQDTIEHYTENNDPMVYPENVCITCKKNKADVGEVDCKFCARKKMKPAGFSNLPNNHQKSISMQLLRENDNQLK